MIVMTSIWFDCISSQRLIAGTLVINTAVLGKGRTFQEVGSNIRELGHWGSAPERNGEVLNGLQSVACFV